MIGYNSHGKFTSLEEIIELETDRGNFIDKDLIKFAKANKNKYQAIWICLKPKDAIRYCSHNEQIGDGQVSDLFKIDLTDGVIWTSMDDGDDGYLFIRRK